MSAIFFFHTYTSIPFSTPRLSRGFLLSTNINIKSNVKLKPLIYPK